MVRHIEPFRRFTWSKGRLSEPSWLGSWVDSPEHHCEKKICFFLKVGFCRICRFFFFSSSPSIFLFLSCSLFFVPRTPHPTPPHPIAHAARSYLPLHYPPPPCLLGPHPTPPKPCCSTPELSFCSLCQALFARVRRAQKTSFLCSTQDRCPPYPLTPQPCISSLTRLSVVAR